MSQFARAAFAVPAAMMLLTACGGGEGNSSNGAAAPTVAANDFAIGNDASAMEIVGSGNVAAPDLPMNEMAAGDNGSAGNEAAPSESRGNAAASKGSGR